MGASQHGRYQGAKATPAHYARLPIKVVSEIPIKDDDRVTAPVIDSSAAWYVLATVPRGEVKAVRGLRKLGYEAYSPVETCWVRHSRTQPQTKREVQRSIFTRYVFFAVRPGQSWHPLREKDAFGRNKLGIVGVISIAGVPCRAPTEPIARLAEEEREGWFDERRRPELEKARAADLGRPAYDPVVRVGESVQILSGPFALFQGEAEEDATESGATLRILVNVFGRATTMVLPIEDVENLDRPIPRKASELQRA